MAASAPAQAVTVVVRTRPTARLSDNLVLDPVTNSVTLRHRPFGGATETTSRVETFNFHRVLHEANQDEVYAATAQSLVSQVVKGVNATVCCYGQTGAGKTHTILGDPLNFRNRGIAPRAITQLFAELADKPELEVSVAVSYMELYQEHIHDLLERSHFAKTMRVPGTGAGAGASGATPDYAIVDDPVQGTTVRGLTLVPVANEEEALNALFAGETARITAEHVLNARSNRSHCIFTLHVRQRSRLGGGRERIVVSKMHLVDLAGSERLKKTVLGEGVTPAVPSITAAGGAGGAGSAAGYDGGMDTQLARESRAINQSLSYLEQCVVALARAGVTGRATHIPYRQTKLTSVLKDSLGGACYTVFIAGVWPEDRHLEETTSTLRLASRMMAVHNETPTAAVTFDTAELLRKYERQVALLQQELAMHDALSDRSGIAYGEYTPEQQAALAVKLRAYLSAPDGEDVSSHLSLDSVSQMRELLRQVKVLVRTAGVEAEERLRERYVLVPKAGSGAASAGSGSVTTDGGPSATGATSALHGGGSGGGGGALGDLDREMAGLSLGIAASGARPMSMSALTAAGRAAFARTSSAGLGGSGLTSPGSPAATPSGGVTRATVSRAPSPLGASPSPHRPTSPSSAGIGVEATARAASPGGGFTMGATAGSLGAGFAESPPTGSPALQDAWRRFKEPGLGPSEGVAAGRRLAEAKADAASKRDSVNASAKAVNAAKGVIDVLTAQLAAATKDDARATISRQLLEAKARYRQAHAAHQVAREAYAFSTAAADTASSQLLQLFTSHHRLGASGGSGGGGFGSTGGFGGTGLPTSSFPEGKGGDVLDEAEAFERLQRERVAAVDPDSLSFFAATRHLRQAATSGRALAGGR